MRATLFGWLQTKKPEFRRDLLAIIGAATPQETSELALAHAQAIARTFTAITVCRHRNKTVNAKTEEVELFLRTGDNLAWVDNIWNKALSERR